MVFLKDFKNSSHLFDWALDFRNPEVKQGTLLQDVHDILTFHPLGAIQPYSIQTQFLAEKGYEFSKDTAQISHQECNICNAFLHLGKDSCLGTGSRLSAVLGPCHQTAASFFPGNGRLLLDLNTQF